MRISTTPRYSSAFWNFVSGKQYDINDIVNIRPEDPAGFYLPDDSLERFRAEQEKMNIFRNIATVLFTDSSDTKIKTVPPSGDAAFVDENGTIPESTVGITSFTVKANKISKISKISNELLNDAGFNIESALAADFGREFGKVEENACLNGNGVNRPYGVLHATDGAETGVTATGTLTFDSIKALYFSLAPEYRRNAVWLMSDETALYIRGLKDAVGASVWRDFDDSIFARRVYTSPYMRGIATGNKPVLFGDFRFYWLMERGGIILKPLREKYAAMGLTGFIGTEFFDGRLVRQEAVKALEIVN